jgi:hypothetical protein
LPKRHRYTFLTRGLIAFLLSWTAIFSYGNPARAQGQGRIVTLTLLPDLVHQTVTVQATVYPGTLAKEAAGLSDWGLKNTFTAWKADDKSGASPWYLQGTLNAAQIMQGENGFYDLQPGTIKLAAGDSLKLAVPFANLNYTKISPAPENLAELANPEPIGRLNPNPLRLISYSAGENGKVLDLDIPFKPLRKKIDLALIPLVGEEMRGQRASFRLAGQVTFDDITDWVEFLRHCDNAPESNYYRYRVADLLFAIDYPPAYHFGYLLPAYVYKPTFTNLSSNIVSCEYKSGSGQVAAQFSGRAFAQTANPGLLPEFLKNQDVAESNNAIRVQNRATGRYQIRMGEIVLDRGDVLRVQMPGSEILRVDPAPTEFTANGLGQTEVLFEGPQRFELTIDYSYRADLVLRQLPATVRVYGSTLEYTPGTSSQLPFGWQTWTLLLIGLALTSIGSRAMLRYRTWIEFAGWIIVGAALYFDLRNVFGWMLLAVLLYIRSAWPDRRSMGRGLLVGILVILSILADQAAEKILFPVLASIGGDLTPFTPAILSLLILLAFLTIFYKDGKPKDWTPGKMLPFALFLFSLSVYDAMQNSLPALVLAGIWTGLLVLRARRENPAELQVLQRFALVFRERIFLIGLVILTVFETTYGLAATPDLIVTFSPGLGIFRQFLPPVLLVLSILLSFLTTGALFVMLYPLLPFEAGPLKAVFFALALLSLFTFGIGSDNRLVTGLEQMLVGRFIYYLSIPLLIGVILDVKQMIAGEPEPEKKGISEKEPESPMSRLRNGLKQYLEQQERILSTVGALVSLAAPTLYATIFNQPLVTTYFQILRVLITI